MKNKMRLVSQYEQYGNKDNWDSSSKIKCVCDEQIYTNVRENKQVMLLIEPRSIQPMVYEHVLKVYKEYEYVFTHDSYLLNVLPNAKPILWGGVWCRKENPEKNRLISMISSDKEMCELHKERKRIARKYRGKIDVYGTIDGGNYVDTLDTLESYMYSVVIENYIDDLWFSEKICNCFATKTIPIYYGARDIGKYFNPRGIINCHSIEEVEEKIQEILKNPNNFKLKYDYSKLTLNENYELSKKYEKFDDWLYKTYEKEIEELFE